jgi:hypothetical protein
MNSFKDFGIKPIVPSFAGDKIKIAKLLNKQITVLNFEIKKSNYDKGSGKCLYMQIEFEGERRVVFHGSSSASPCRCFPIHDYYR